MKVKSQKSSLVEETKKSTQNDENSDRNIDEKKSSDQEVDNESEGNIDSDEGNIE